ncbi:cation:proton antiporter [uncultured Pseudokineococcus sp.]|uniref:cation:proton antiporter domain-containing protein n=1 Tax=uncultured Pseudokineococcus sp. TaxID=1642928 RepID=UPI0026315DE9|nr:cation:proton antiporter [uncultured Pseudokineococcus sp.]
MSTLHLVYAVVGVAGVLLALVSSAVRRWPISEPLVALALGVLLGPAALGLVVVGEETRDLLLLEGARLLLAWSVMAAALRFRYAGLRSVLRPVALLLVLAMPAAVLVGGAAALAMGLPVGLALLLGACLSPTDPVLASSVVSGGPAERDLPARLRQVLTAESGVNDGLGLPFVLVGLAVVLPGLTGGAAAVDMAREVLGAVVVGAVLGAVTGALARRADDRGTLAGGPRLVLTLLLAVAVLGVARVAGTDGVLAVFVAGVAYNRVVPSSDREPQDSLDEAVNRYAVLPFFLLLGAVLPWADWADLGWGAAVFAVAALLVRRLPALLLLHRPLGMTAREGAFAGWFGPMGVSAVFYLAHSLEEGVADPRLLAAGTLAVAVSVVAFGVTAAPATRRFGRARQDAPS